MMEKDNVAVTRTSGNGQLKSASGAVLVLPERARAPSTTLEALAFICTYEMFV